MSDLQKIVEETHETVETIEKLLIGNINKPEIPGLIIQVQSNTKFRKGLERMRMHFYLVLVGLVALSLFNMYWDP